LPERQQVVYLEVELEEKLVVVVILVGEVAHLVVLEDPEQVAGMLGEAEDWVGLTTIP
jgi:hypothetical protein